MWLSHGERAGRRSREKKGWEEGSQEFRGLEIDPREEEVNLEETEGSQD